MFDVECPMLQFLRIRNLALVERAELEFGAGFTAVTGETGAGKSVLLGALSLLAGNRADKTVIRQGAEACEAEGVLSFSGAALTRMNALLDRLSLPPCEDGSLVLRRTLSATKAPRIQINGALATLGALQELGENWVDFHGPGEPQKLFQEKHQREMLDAFGRLENRLLEFSAYFQQWRDGLREADELSRAGRMSADEIDFTRLQIGRIDQVDPTPENLAALERDFNRSGKAQELGRRARHPIGKRPRWRRRLGREISPIGARGPRTGGTRPIGRFARAALGGGNCGTARELGGDFGRLGAGLEFDEETARSLQERMSLWLELQRRYGPDPAALRAKRDELARKVAAQSDIEGTLARFSAESATREKALRREAAKLREARTEAAQTLEKKAARLLKALGFKQAGLQITVTASPEMREHGDSQVDLLFAPNPGQAPLPLNKIASSGETARVMLALKAVLAEADATPLLVFDEVDANVGGEIGAAVGRELAALGAKHQVLCVTHLPQVAARAARHLVVEKHHAAKARPAGRASPFAETRDDAAARVDEITRGCSVTAPPKSAQQHAKALLAEG